MNPTIEHKYSLFFLNRGDCEAKAPQQFIESKSVATSLHKGEGGNTYLYTYLCTRERGDIQK
jgi:hypothetical protein